MHETSSGIPDVQPAQSSNGKTQDEVLVCAYASYNYLYADPVKCCSKFENIFKQNNHNYKEIFHNSLELDPNVEKSTEDTES